MNKLRSFFLMAWQPVLTVLIGAGLTLFTLGYRLGSLTPGMSPDEMQALSGTTSLHAIALNPVFLPFKIGEFLVYKLGISMPITVRGVSAIIGFFCVWGFYLLLKRWHTRRLAILGTLLFLTSTWFLSTARTATPDILYVFNALSVIFIGALVHQKKASKSSLLLAAICAALLVYSPGMVWLLLIGVVWQYKGIISLLKQNPVWLWGGASVLFVVLLLPAVYASINDMHFILDIFAVSEKVVPVDMLKRLYIVPSQLFVQGPNSSSWLARLPIMDIFTGAMFVTGLYNYYLRFTIKRTRFLLFTSLIVLLLIAAFSIPTVTILPVIYIIIVGGVTLLLQQWFTVFPLNPIARNIGFVIMFIAIATSAWFQMNRYFIAWRYNPATQQTYQVKLIR